MLKSLSPGRARFALATPARRWAMGIATGGAAGNVTRAAPFRVDFARRSPRRSLTAGTDSATVRCHTPVELCILVDAWAPQD